MSEKIIGVVGFLSFIGVVIIVLMSNLGLIAGLILLGIIILGSRLLFGASNTNK